MKKIIFLLMLPAFCQSQFSLAPRMGMNDNKRLLFGLDMAYGLKNFEPAISISEIQHTHEAAYLTFRAGYTVPTGNVTFMPIVGRSYRAQTFDKNEFQVANKWLWDAGMRIEKHLPCMIENSAIFIQADYIGQFQLTIGVKL